MRGIGRCFSFSPALLPLLLLISDGVDELERLVQHLLRRLDGVVEQDRHVQHKHMIDVVVQWEVDSCGSDHRLGTGIS